VIAGVAKGGLRAIRFSPYNSLESSTYAFGDTVVLTTAHSLKIKTQACSDPEMQQDHQSHNLDGAPELTVQIYPFKFYESYLTFLNQRL
jgi:hypothetical protein